MQSVLIEISRLPFAFQAFFIGVLGAIFGSFFNVCISRWPRQQSAVWKRSHCLHCEQTIFWYHNLPLISYCWLRGRCANCKAKFSSRYFWVEAFTAFAFVAIACWMPMSVWVPSWIFVSLALVASVIDLETFTLPDILLLWGALLGLGVAFFFPELRGASGGLTNFLNAFKDGLLATGAFLWLGFLFESALKKPAFGLGDAFWIGVLAVFISLWGALFSVLAGAVLGTIFMAIAFCLERFFGIIIGPRASLGDLESMDPSDLAESISAPPIGFGVAIPFGPWLSLGGVIYFFFLQSHEKDFLQMFL